MYFGDEDEVVEGVLVGGDEVVLAGHASVDIHDVGAFDLESGDDLVLGLLHHLLRLVELALRHRPLLYRGELALALRVDVELLGK